jgi:hypothetical protein
MNPLLLLLFVCLPLMADELLTPARATLLSGTEFYPVSNLTDGSGLSEDPTKENFSLVTHAAASSSTAWTTNAPGGGSADYYALDSALAPLPMILLEFEQNHEFTHFIFWGYHFGRANGNEAKSFLLEFSNDGGKTFHQSVELFSQAISTLNATILPLGAPISANAIRLTLTDNWFEDFAGGDRVGLGEVRFLGTSTPNPYPILRVQRLADFGYHPSNPGSLVFDLPISNLGKMNNLSITASLQKGNLFFLDTQTLSIESEETQYLKITFASDLEGCFQETLKLETNDPDRPIVEVTLTVAINCSLPEVKQPQFSHEEGTFTQDFLLTLTSPTAGSTVIYTLDGTLPTPENSVTYTEPILIRSSTQIRAATHLPGQQPAYRSRSYILLSNDLLNYQSKLPVLLIENFNRGQIPNKNWTTDTQTGAGLRQVARQSAFLCAFARDPETSLASVTGQPQQTSRIGIRVRGAYSSTWNRKPYSIKTWKTGDDSGRRTHILDFDPDEDWILYYPDPNFDRSMLYNTFIWELSRQTGRWAPDFRFVDVFINEDGGPLQLSDRIGVYVFLEKPTRGKKRLNFEKLSADGTTGGWLNSINRMDPIPVDGFPSENGATSPQFFHTAGPNRIQTTPPNTSGRGDDIPRQYNAFINFEDPNGYRINPMQRDAIEAWYRHFEDVLFDEQMWLDRELGYRQYLDTTNFIDYFQLLTLAKQGDGLLLSMFPWVSSDDRKLRMGPLWDFNNGAYGGSITGTLYFRPDRLWYSRLFQDPQFQREYEDRWFSLRRGPLSNTNMASIIDSQAEELTPNLANQQAGLNAATWASRISSMKTWLQSRANWIDSNFLAPPSFSHPGGGVAADSAISIVKPAGQSGSLFYTIDGTDPLEFGIPYNSPISLKNSVRLSARLLTPEGNWSALISETFIIGLAAAPSHLVISEIHFHPSDEFPDTEFIELLNTSDQIIDLSLVRFTKGISFEFAAGTLLKAQERIVVVENQSAFISRYGDSINIAGEFSNFTNLDNSGESLTLTAADGSLITEFTYDDQDPWPQAADGLGHSLTLILPETRPDPHLSENWRPSVKLGGSPGFTDAKPFMTGSLRDHLLANSEPLLDNQRFSYSSLLAADEFIAVPQTSSDLLEWKDLPLPSQPETISPSGMASYSVAIPSASTKQFLRLSIRRR